MEMGLLKWLERSEMIYLSPDTILLDDFQLPFLTPCPTVHALYFPKSWMTSL